MVNIYQTSIKFEDNLDVIKHELIKDYMSDAVQLNRVKGKYNFWLSNKYKPFTDILYNEFVKEARKCYDFVLSDDNEQNVWAYISNNQYYNLCIHNHKHTADINAVWYLHVPDTTGGELTFYDVDKNKIGEIKPKTNDLLMFDGDLNHVALPPDSEDFRIGLNMEIRTK